LTGADVPKYDNTTIPFEIVVNKKSPFSIRRGFTNY